MTLRLTPKQARKLAFKVEKKQRRRGDPPPVAWNSLSLDAPAKKGRFATSEASARTVDGQVFDSRVEANRYMQLRLLERAGQISDIAVQPSWDIDINGAHFCTYTADFSYRCHERGRVVIEEIKTTGTQKDTAYRLRKRAAELAHGIRVEVLVI